MISNNDYEDLIVELNNFRNLDDDWDGENASKVNIDCLNLCIKYIEKYRSTLDTPDIMIHADGTVSLYWDIIEKKLYKELCFITGERIYGTIIDKISDERYNITLNKDFIVTDYLNE